MKEENQLYVLMNAECEDCGGEGKLETMTALSYDGAQTWKVEVCPYCGGEGVSLKPVRCPFCGDEILKDELADGDNFPCHASCLEESRPTKDAADVCPACKGLKIVRNDDGLGSKECSACNGTGQRR